MGKKYYVWYKGRKYIKVYTDKRHTNFNIMLMNKQLQKITTMLLMAASLLLISCEKWNNNAYKPDIPNKELITQHLRCQLKQ